MKIHNLSTLPARLIDLDSPALLYRATVNYILCILLVVWVIKE